MMIGKDHVFILRGLFMRRAVLCSVFVAILLGACAGMPTQEMSDARQAVQAAREVDAAKHAAAALGQAESALSEAEKELGARDYKKAREHALESRKAAIKAHNMSKAINEAAIAVAEARIAGKPSGEADDLLRRAREAAAAGEEDKAINLAGEARHRAQESLK